MFVPHHTFVFAADRNPERWMLMLHGIYGSGANWRSIARELVSRRPEWGAVLVDLRMHGQSQDAPPPHTVASAAADLTRLSERLAGEGKEVRAVLGHSFGGKVALAYRGLAGPELLQTWVIDASPGSRPELADAVRERGVQEGGESVVEVLHMLRELPAEYVSREDFVAAVRERGFSEMLARWLGMSVQRRGQRYVLGLDVAAMESLLVDVFRLDSWPMLLAGPGEVQVVVAGASSAVSAADRERLEELARAGSLQVTVIAEAGHWVHVDAPDALLGLMASRLPA